MDGLIYLWLGLTVISGCLLTTYGILNTIAEDRKKKSAIARIEALEKKMATLEMWMDYGVHTED